MKNVIKYPKTMIMIHWATLVLFAIIFYVGTTFEDYEFSETNMNRYRTHALLGVFVAFLTIIRYFIKKKNKDRLPADITYYSPMHEKFVKLVLGLIYPLLIITPIVGFVMVYQTGALDYDLGGAFPTGTKFNETLEIVHKVLVLTLAGLIVIHIAGVLMYKIKTGDNLIKRMCLLIK